MRLKLKKLSDQVIVITGATSGIGLTTARMAAKRGAKLVLAARNAEALEKLVGELKENGAEAIYIVADVGKEDQVRHIADVAINIFGRFDTWINNAGVSIFGRNEEVSLEDQHRLFDTNYWGVVHGSLTALSHLKKQGGALINLGSELSDLAVPLQGTYSASKHAVKGFTDSLRVELEEEGAPVSVTLIKPAALATMFVPHAKNYLEVEPKLPSPVYAPELAAEAILSAAENPTRDIYVGGAAKLVSSSAHYAPAMVDAYMKRFMFKGQKSDMPAGDREYNGLYTPTPGSDLSERSQMQGKVLESSPYTTARLHPRITRLIAAGIAAMAFLTWWQSRRSAAR